MNNENIESIVNNFKSDSKPNDRYTSFDYCYNYFLETKDLTKDIEKSCLVLGFYLASWGMLRGSSFLLQKSAKHYQSTIEYISTLEKSVWKIDADNYTEDNIEIILNIYENVKKRLIKTGNSDLTLVTKILLGVFGFIPAFDQYFCNTFREIFADKNCGFRAVNLKSLNCIKDFYEQNKIEIDKLSKETFTTDFKSETKTLNNYTTAKIIDMYGFTVGLKK
jgi:hypothetical protein